jgi:hypothetical protein
MALCSHYSCLQYNEWALDYLIAMMLCPPTLQVHPRYSSMCINVNAFGLVLSRFMWSRAPITFSRSPSAYRELTALHHITCGWTLFQELIWACSPRMNGSFRDYHCDIRVCLPKAQELIASFFLRIQKLAHEIVFSCDFSGMQHELLHHFVQVLGKNMDDALTRGVILQCILQIKQLRRLPTHTPAPLPFTYHEVVILLRDGEITHYLAGRSLSSSLSNPTDIPGLHDPVAASSGGCSSNLRVSLWDSRTSPLTSSSWSPGMFTNSL